MPPKFIFGLVNSRRTDIILPPIQFSSTFSFFMIQWNAWTNRRLIEPTVHWHVFSCLRNKWHKPLNIKLKQSKQFFLKKKVGGGNNPLGEGGTEKTRNFYRRMEKRPVCKLVFYWSELLQLSRKLKSFSVNSEMYIPKLSFIFYSTITFCLPAPNHTSFTNNPQVCQNI